MKLEEEISKRSGDLCELSGQSGNLKLYHIPPFSEAELDNTILVDEGLLSQIEKRTELNPALWENILSQSIWSELAAVQVVSWRLLNRMKDESWATDLLDMMYLDEDSLKWAKSTGEHEQEADLYHKDINGFILNNGDTVTLIKDLNVKGSSINAKIGTAVRNIRLVHDNHAQIEGKIDGQLIVILTQYVKKQA